MVGPHMVQEIPPQTVQSYPEHRDVKQPKALRGSVETT